MVTPEIVSVAVPVLVTVVLIPAEVTPTSVLGKASAVAESDIPKAVPVPERVTICGEPVTLSAMLSWA